ncbi:uncharacterized protein LOC129600005 [Paramacrobiotus metropolitanus]|uniref:uncharacterized protein LOC129600005 n=1 Tax=Paramacrobiotus metropolitanus TaxID=2943436 RepID=UPI002445B2CA|nr:uncharacterized protein LOC129600005 [Paramacrobiotus metropolitanus]XP_055354356.1 uncharacterized protein LOC129600005 [Paramacrobiotus metropolitanus]
MLEVYQHWSGTIMYSPTDHRRRWYERMIVNTPESFRGAVTIALHDIHNRLGSSVAEIANYITFTLPMRPRSAAQQFPMILEAVHELLRREILVEIAGFIVPRYALAETNRTRMNAVTGVPVKDLGLPPPDKKRKKNTVIRPPPPPSEPTLAVLADTFGQILRSREEPIFGRIIDRLRHRNNSTAVVTAVTRAYEEGRLLRRFITQQLLAYYTVSPHISFLLEYPLLGASSWQEVVTRAAGEINDHQGSTVDEIAQYICTVRPDMGNRVDHYVELAVSELVLDPRSISTNDPERGITWRINRADEPGPSRR